MFGETQEGTVVVEPELQEPQPRLGTGDPVLRSGTMSSQVEQSKAMSLGVVMTRRRVVRHLRDVV
jgi:hypothetical protein